MKVAFSTLGCPEWSWGDILSAAKDLGYNGIEVRGVNDELFVPSIFANKEDKIKMELSRLSLEIPCLTSACYLNEVERHNKHIEDGKKYIDTAKTIGVPYIRLLGDYTPQPQGDVDAVAVKDAAQILADYAKGSGVQLLIESNGYFAKSERLAKLMQDINREEVAVLWDIHHPFRFFGEPAKETFQNLNGKIKHLHMKDSTLHNGVVHYCSLGSGDLPIEEMVGLMQGSGYKGYYSLEWTKRWNLDLEEPGIAFAGYVDFMRHL